MKSRAFTDSPLFHCGQLSGSVFCFSLPPLSIHPLSSLLLRSSPRQMKALFYGVSWTTPQPPTPPCVSMYVHECSCMAAGQLRSALFLCAGHLMVRRREGRGCLYLLRRCIMPSQRSILWILTSQWLNSKPRQKTHWADGGSAVVCTADLECMYVFVSLLDWR